MVLPLSVGRMMMFSFCWRYFKDVECFLVMWMIELRSARMVSASSVVIRVNIVSILATRSIVGRAPWVMAFRTC